MSQTGPTPPSPTEVEDRRMRFEARKFALDSLLRIHLNHLEGSRLLLVSHARLMFTLALAALAGVLTLFTTDIRDMNTALAKDGAMLPIGLGAVSVVLLSLAALLSGRMLHAAMAASASLVRDPYPQSESALERVFNDDTILEKEIVLQTTSVLGLRLQMTPVYQPATLPVTLMLAVGLIAAAASILAG
jgi:hypothetical protein